MPSRRRVELMGPCGHTMWRWWTTLVTRPGAELRCGVCHPPVRLAVCGRYGPLITLSRRGSRWRTKCCKCGHVCWSFSWKLLSAQKHNTKACFHCRWSKSLTRTVPKGVHVQTVRKRLRKGLGLQAAMAPVQKRRGPSDSTLGQQYGLSKSGVRYRRLNGITLEAGRYSTMGAARRRRLDGKSAS